MALLQAKSILGTMLTAYVGLTPSSVLTKATPSNEEYFVCRPQTFYDLACKIDSKGIYFGSTNVPTGVCTTNDPMPRRAMFVPMPSELELANACETYRTNGFIIPKNALLPNTFQ